MEEYSNLSENDNSPPMIIGEHGTIDNNNANNNLKETFIVSQNNGHMATPSPPPISNGGISSSVVGQKNAYSTVATAKQPPHSHHLHHHHSDHASHQQGAHKLTRVKSLDTCRVCGDGPARMHYGVPTCFGCKGFFRRTLKRPKEYTCRYSGNCVVDRYERNSCRFCRFKRCLEVGMDPKAVRPDRDAAGRSHPIRHRRSRTSLGELGGGENGSENGEGGEATGATGIVQRESDDWIRKLPVDMRTLLMQIMNMELLVANGDTNEDAKHLYPLPFGSLREILEDPTLLDGKRTEIRYETYRRVHADEFVAIAHRRLIAVIDMVDHLSGLMDLHNIEDKVTLVKASYAPLSIFCSVAATARATRDRNILCLCSFGYVPRGLDRMSERGYEEPYYFANRLVDRTLDELVEPFRVFNFKEQEVVLMKAIVTLNPHLRTLSTEASEQISDLRDRVQEALYNVVRESHPKEVASSRFGNLLLFLPNIMLLGNVMYENLQFIQSFGKQHIDPLLNELLDNIEPMDDNLDGDAGVAAFDEVLSLSSYQSTNSISGVGACGTDASSMMRHSMSASSMSSTGTAGTGSTDTTGSSVSCNGIVGDTSSFFSGGRRVSSTSSHLCESIQLGGDFQTTTSQQDLYKQQQSYLDGKEQQQQQQLQQQQLSSVESDPDYNITLTAENLSGMRQAIVQSMEVDNTVENCQAVTSDYFSDSNCQQPQKQDRPNFYIDPNSSNSLGNISKSQCCMNGYAQAQACGPNSPILYQNTSNGIQQMTASCASGLPHTTVGTRHVFTIEPAKENGKISEGNIQVGKLQFSTHHHVHFQHQQQQQHAHLCQHQAHHQHQHETKSTQQCCVMGNGISQPQLSHAFMASQAAQEQANGLSACRDSTRNTQKFMQNGYATSDLKMESPPPAISAMVTSQHQLLCTSGSVMESPNYERTRGSHGEIGAYTIGGCGCMVPCGCVDNSQQCAMSKSQSYPYVVQALMTGGQQPVQHQQQRQQQPLQGDNFCAQFPPHRSQQFSFGASGGDGNAGG